MGPPLMGPNWRSPGVAPHHPTSEEARDAVHAKRGSRATAQDLDMFGIAHPRSEQLACLRPEAHLKS
jgi:hypothetical protein